ncbi:MAG: PTS sugar transporter subunit IIA [Spirochaetaceae bacterium]|nr:MAG: PTS sugar transporter subunit IIA [Spirochaetaceae bacterium]
MLDARTIKLELEARKKNEALQELIELLHRAGKIQDPEAALAGLIAREKLTSTGIGSGIAIPHLLAEQAEETVMAFGRKREGLRFDSVDNQPVTLIFLIVGPKHQEYAHLRLLSRLSRLLHDESFRQALLEAETAEEILRIVTQEEQREG